MDKINGMLLVIDTAEISVVIREYEAFTRFSVKTVSGCRPNAKSIAIQFYGKGHPEASGGRSNIAPEELQKQIVDYCLSQLSEPAEI